MLLNKQIAFTYSFKDTLKIALIAGVFVLFIMVFLQPFDTFQSQMELKMLKLSGYGLAIALPIIFLHFINRFWYKMQNFRWTILNEIIYLVFLALLSSIASFFYHHFVLSGNAITVSNITNFFIYYCIPFFPIILPLVTYLRFTFGKVVITDSKHKDKPLTISGENKDEKISISMSQFVYAEAQQNYVDIHYLDEDNVVNKEILRSTFSNVVEQIEDAYQVHRSYLINPMYLSKISGNSRKRLIELEKVDTEIPVSKKYYQAIEKHLQNRP